MRKRHILWPWLAPLPIVAALAVVAVAVLNLGFPSTAVAAQPNSTHHTAPRIHLADGRDSTSTNWSGYANTGAKFTDVKGSWTEPSASCSGQTAYSSFWVGIDGDTDSTVEQIGTDSDCSSGTPTYYAWYEMYPKFPFNLSTTQYPVSPGDSLTAEVQSLGSGRFQLSISDSKHGWSYSTTQTMKHARLASAEWIAEAPSGSGGVLPLSDFGSVNFSNCTTNYGAINASGQTVDQITMVTSSGQNKAVPSGLTGGTGFSVAWKSS